MEISFTLGCGSTPLNQWGTRFLRPGGERSRSAPGDTCPASQGSGCSRVEGFWGLGFRGSRGLGVWATKFSKLYFGRVFVGAVGARAGLGASRLYGLGIRGVSGF